MSSDVPRLDTYAAAYLKKSRGTTGKQLYEALRLNFRDLTEDEFADLVQRLASRGQIKVYDEQIGKSLLHDYLADWGKSLWFYTSIIASVAAAITAYGIPPNSPFLVLRMALGLLFVLFLPGYVTVEALLPAMELNVVSRVVLSVGVSLVLDMFSGLALNFTPWGIRLVPIVLSLGTLTICIATLALVRKFREARRGSRRITVPTDLA